MPAVLEQLDTKISDLQKKASDSEAAASAKRDELTGEGKSVPEVNSDGFKELTDELSAHYAELDQTNDTLAGLKSQRATLGRTIGAPAPDNGGEGKGVNSDELAELIAAAQGKSAGAGPVRMGSRIIEAKEYKSLVESGRLRASNAPLGAVHLGKGMDRTEFKDLISGTGVAGFKDPMRTEYQPLAQRVVKLLDLVQHIPTDQESVKYAQMTVAGHNVELVADPSTAADITPGDSEADPLVPEVTAVAAGLKPESAYTFTSKTAEIETIAHTLPIHKNQLADIPQLEAILNDEMIRGLYLFLEKQIVSGNGSGQLNGIINTANIVSQAKSSDSLIVAIHKAITGCRILFEEPTTVVISPKSWEDIRLMRDDSGASTGTGGFLFGPPSQAGDSTLWGLDVIVSPLVEDDKPILGDFSGAQLYLREGVEVLASDSHKDFFTRNLIMLLAEMRVGFGVRRPGAFGKVT